jgi:hypothetical protein
MGWTVVVYDVRGWERFRSPLLIAERPSSTALVTTLPFPDSFTTYSYAVIDDAGNVFGIGTGTLEWVMKYLDIQGICEEIE